jgi:hypothetical protein
MSGHSAGVLLGGIQVHTTSNRGWSPEEIADRAVDKIIYVGKESNPIILAQAEAFKANIRAVLVECLTEAMHAERTNIYAKLQASGHAELADIIRSL